MSSSTSLKRDLALGLRLAASGGRDGWLRNALTALGIGLGVTLLLLCSSIPHMLQAHNGRGDARHPSEVSLSGTYNGVRKGPDTLVVAAISTEFDGREVDGYLVQPDDLSGHPPVPPGLHFVPGAGEMAVSPALKSLLDSPRGHLLHDRLPYHVAETIGRSGLLGPDELYFYAGRADLAESKAPQIQRIDHIGVSGAEEGYGPALSLLILVAFVALLMPVGIFIANAVRVGGERRDRRLAALRLVGADTIMIRRIAAGETLFGTLLGLVLGGVLFVQMRAHAGAVTLFDLTFFPSDVTPAAAFTVLIVVLVPVSAVLVTLHAMRGVTVDPLGVVRNTTPVRKRVWWRLLLPVVGAGLLIPSFGKTGASQEPIGEAEIIAGTALLLVGVTLIIPWVVETAVRRLSGGSIPWHLAVRRVQMGAGASGRMVGGITAAVAGAIALQMLFAAVQTQSTQSTTNDVTRAQLQVTSYPHDGHQAISTLETFQRTRGVASAIGLTTEQAVPEHSSAQVGDAEQSVGLTVGDCRSLREVVSVPDCTDGDVYIVPDPQADKDVSFQPKAGEQITLGEDKTKVVYRVPSAARSASPRQDPLGQTRYGIFATPKAFDIGLLNEPSVEFLIQVDPAVAGASDTVRTIAAVTDPMSTVIDLKTTKIDHKFDAVSRAIFAGAAGVIVLIGIGMLISTQEQLRERRALVAYLTAIGMRRVTLGGSILLQTAIPLALGLAVSAVGGSALGFALQAMVGVQQHIYWGVVATAVGSGAAIAMLMLLFSLPLLWRLARPDGLRTE
ncbi:FtsX-like permease family protein (plasmid) [Streptomyces sp. AHU1]|uniref:FtsX-like permease family protein n=1 Tax=Streptomyces sp. AHU1 TaxID=3377215 RepID=UPI003877A619